MFSRSLAPRFVFALGALLLLTARIGPAAHAEATFASIQWGNRYIHVAKAQTVATSLGKGVRVCSVDTGVANIPDIASSLASGTNTVDALTPTTFADDEGHGTATSSIIVGHGYQIQGVAPNASLLVAKVLDKKGAGDSGSVTAGMLWCGEHGAQLENVSLGGPAAAYDGFATAVRWLCQQKHVLIVAAAGNDGQSGRQQPTDPAHVKSRCMISVGALDKKGRLTQWSNFVQNHNQINAPGQNIVADYPDGTAGVVSGTSLAAPYVTGTLALVMGMGVGPFRALHDILASARHPKGYDPKVDGYGNLNAYAAVLLARKQLLGVG